MPRGTLRYNAKKEKVYIALLAVVILILGRGVWVLYVKHKVATGEQAAIEEKLLRAEERLRDLSQEVKNLETERGIEESIRTKFNVAKPGEKTVVLVASEVNTASVENKSFWATLKTFLFGEPQKKRD